MRAARVLRIFSLDTWAIIALVAVVVLAHAVYLLDFSDPNPLGPRSALAASAVLGPLSGQPVADPNDGFTAQALGHRAMLDVTHGHLPWWNLYEGTGAPLAGEMQSAALFPPTLLLLLSNGQLYEHILLELVAGVATYRLLRRLGVIRWASLAGGIAFALDGTFAWFGHAPVNPVAFLPLLLLGIERAYRASLEKRAGGWRLIALAGALSFYAGFPEVTYIDTLLAVLWWAWRLGCLSGAQRRALAIKAAAGGVLAVLLAAPLMIAGLDYLAHSDLGTHTTAAFGSGHFPASALPQLLMPYIYGPISGFADPRFVLTGIWGQAGGYLSILLATLAALGLLSPGRRGLRIVLAAWSVLVVARVYGVPGLGAVLGWLPGMGHVAFSRYAFASLELAVIVLAALGIDDLVARARRRRAVLATALTALAAIAAAALGAHALASQLGAAYAHRRYFEVAVAWAIITLAVLVFLALRRMSPRARGIALALLVTIDAVVMFSAPELSAPRSVQVDTGPVTYLQRAAGSERMFTLGPLAPDYGSYYGLASLNVNDLPIPTAFAHYVRAHLDAYVDPTVFVGNLGGGRSPFVPSPEDELEHNLGAYRAAGVGFVLSPAGQRLPQSRGGLTLVARTPTTWIYGLSDPAPLFSAGPGCTTISHGLAAATVRCPRPAQLIYRETDMPGWSATVGSSSTPIRRAGGLFQSVTVPAGTHTVRFSFAPPGIVWGGIALLAGLIGLAIPTSSALAAGSAR